jgi:Zn-dependent membrane protease YugP
MILGIGMAILLLLIFGPQMWTRHVFKKYSSDIDDMPGTGGELATHLLDILEISDAIVEETETGNDHYDPEAKAVRLSPAVYNGKSLTAITVAAHECGHALQHKTHYQPLYFRWKMARYVMLAEKIASFLLVASPFIIGLTRMPAVGGVAILSGLTLLLLPVLFHLVTLPVEFNASFGRALPILSEGQYLPQSAIPIARQILTAAALTYLSASLASILNFYRWLMILRR